VCTWKECKIAVNYNFSQRFGKMKIKIDRSQGNGKYEQISEYVDELASCLF
jgi:hypothetical protein